MRTGLSNTLAMGRGGRSRPDARLKNGRKSRSRWLDMDGLESRTLLATIPAITATGAPINLTNLSSVTSNGDANSPAVVIDPYDSQKIFAVWGVDLSQLTTVPHTTAIVEGAYSADGGTNWTGLGTGVAPVQLDAATINATPPTNYTQVTDPSVAFDGQGNVYILTLQSTGANDGELYLTEFNFSGSAPSQVPLPNGGTVYQWVTGSDAATSPVVAVDTANPAAPGTPDPYANNVYIAWASIDTEPANPNPYVGPGFNPNRAELVVGTPISNPAGNEASLAFSGVKTLSIGGNFGPADNSHPQLVINQTDGGQITVAWDDFGSGSKASPPFDELISSLVQPGDTYGFSTINPGPFQAAGAQSAGNWVEPTFGSSGIYNAGPVGFDADPTSIAVGDVNGANGNDIVLADEGINQIGELLNNGTGTFPATATTFDAGNSPVGVVLGNITQHSTAINDAAVANYSGGVSVLTNDGTGNFGSPNHLIVTPEQETAAIAAGNLDGSGQSLVAVNEGNNSITIFPDGSATGAVTLNTGLNQPIAVVVADFRGPGSNPDIAVLNSNGTIQFFLNPNAGIGDFNFTAGPSINVGAGAVAMATGQIFTAGHQDLAVVLNVNGAGTVEVLKNTSTVGSISFNAAVPLPYTLPGAAVGVATGNLSGISSGLNDIAVLYQNATNSSAIVNESMVAILQNNGIIGGNISFTRVSPPSTPANPNPLDYDAGTTFPTSIAVANVSGGTFEDIIVASNEAQGYVSVLKASPLPPGPSKQAYSVPVNVPNPAAVTDLTVTVDLVDQESVQNLSLTLYAPNGDQITLVQNQNNSAGTARTFVGLNGGNAIGVFGFTTGATGSRGIQIGTIFDDNATRNIFDPTTTGTNGNSASGSGYVGFFQPEGNFGFPNPPADTLVQLGEADTLKNFVALEASEGDINSGSWNLTVTNYTSTVATGVPFQGLLENLSLQFTTGMTASAPRNITTTLVTGAIGNNFATAVPSSPNGVGPGLVLAVDNTLGPDSPFQGRVYAAYVVYYNDEDPNTHVNPTTNTDIALSYSDNGGRSWVFAGIVNDDASDADGYSSSSIDSASNYTSGRTQFQPAIAVDPATGTLVISWRDARDDAANARVATYIGTSIDGGNSFSAQTYANPPVTAIDAITGQTDVLGPQADNQSGGDGQRDSTFGYGDQMGLAVFDGQVYPVWAGNFNQSYLVNGAVTGRPLNIYYRPMVIAAGPGIINSSMGPIPLSEAESGSVSISVTFDRPVTASTFVIGDVQVFYHDTTYGDPSIPLEVTGISPQGPGTSTQFTITFNPAENADGLPSGITNYTGTYSYLIAPDNGAGLAISSPIESYSGPLVDGVATLVAFDADDQNTDGRSDENAVTTAFVGTTPGDVYAVPAPAPSTAIQFDGAASILSPPFNQQTLPLIVPGPQVLSTSVPGGDSASGNLITDGTTNTLSVTFDRPMQVSTFTPGQVLQIMGPAGSISGPQYFPSTTSTGQIIPAASATSAGTLDSTLTIPSYNGTFTIAHLTVTLNAAFSPDSALTAELIAPGGMVTGTLTTGSASVTGLSSTTGLVVGENISGTGIPSGTTILAVNSVTSVITLSANATASGSQSLTAYIPLFSGVGGAKGNFTNTILDDSSEFPITKGTAPFTGTYSPTGKLSTLIGDTVDTQNAEGQWVAGVWTLQLINTATGSTGMLDNWSLNITPQISVTPVNAVGGNATTFMIGFPLQQLSGTYTIQLGPTILDTFGDGLDTTQDAGLAVLRDQDQNAPTTTVVYNAGDLPQGVTAPVSFMGTLTMGDASVTGVSSTTGLYVGADVTGTGIPTGTTILAIDSLGDTITLSANATVTGSESLTASSQVSSTITVPDDFIIKGDKTAAGASVMKVQINLTYPTDADLTAVLTHYGAGGVNLGQVTLFSGVGSGVTTANFDNTVFDDNAATPIQDGSAPFFSTFNPQQSLATVFAPAPDGMSVQGTWVLSITNNSTTGGTGTFNSWSLAFQDTQPTSGLGVPGADDATASFRIFTLGQADALSSEQWTAVGPASIGEGSGGNAGSDPSGRVTGLAIDPSDPSGNTVYAAGASGGIWKTTDFLTTSSAGPTWIPLTDFGPTSAVNVGGIAVFPRNNNTNQSIIIAATGEGDTGTPGVGFLVSQDGGATWTLDDSTDNVDSNGNILPINSTARDREFVGNTSFQVVVDPELTPSGGVIIYAAMSGPNGGIWRSENTGATWTLLMAGQATSVVLDPESGIVLDPSTNTYVQGNLQIVYAGIRGVGVFMSPNQGQNWTQMLGGIGNPLIFDDILYPFKNVNPAASPTPNGGEGRIELAVPSPTGNAAEDAVYEGWLYAIVSNPAGALDGIFVTKDFGENWTQVRIPTEPNQGYASNPAIPTNNVGLADYPVIGSAMFPQGNYNIAIAVDPTDPSVIYVGGTADGNQAALIRINLTDIWDAHSLVATSDLANDGGALTLASTGPATISNIKDPVEPTSYLNFIRNPEDPFEVNSTIYVFNYASFTNNGDGVDWIPLPSGGTDYHRIVTMVDPATGLPRLIFGDDQGVWSLLDDNGTPIYQIGSSDSLPGNSRNGNLQITQFYYGAAQPSNAAALIAGSLFYGSAQDNGGPSSAANVIDSGNIVWNGPGGDASGVATDQQGNGTLYQYFWPCCGGGDTDFFQVNGIGQTFGLLQASGGQPTPDPQWPYLGGANFAVNPVNGQDIVISSAVGRIFSTTNEALTWFDVGDPATFGSPGGFSNALAYGAPDPTAPSGIGNLGNFIYVGTSSGRIYVTQAGGGTGTSAGNWLNVSSGLDGSAIKQIITDPTRGSHDAYAVTSSGVYYIANSIPSAANPTPTWVNITNNLKTLAYAIFGQSYNPQDDKQPYDLAVALTSIAADWRYAIPNGKNPVPTPEGYFPALYVGADSGVFQSLDNGQTWTLFPDTTYGALTEGGYLPHVSVSTLSLSLGDIAVATGMPTTDGPYAPNAANQTAESAADPDVLLATTYGQGSFAINLAPLIVGNAFTVTPTSPPVSDSPLPVVDTPITISGTSEITAFGNATWITVEDVTNPADPVIVAGFNPADPVPTPGPSNSTNAVGQFSIPFNPETYYTTNGIKTIEVFATDNAGSVGNVVTYSFNLNPPTQLQFAPGGEPPATGIAGQNFAFPLPVIVDAEDAAGTLAQSFVGTVTISLFNNTTDTILGTLTEPAINGVATFPSLTIDTTGTYELEATSNPALTPATSTPITINPATPTQLVWVTQPSGEPPAQVTAGAPFMATLDLEDQFGNLETGYNQSATVALDLQGQPTTVALGGATIMAVGGVLDFSDLTIDKVGDPYTLIATTDGVTSLASTGINVVAGPEAGLVIDEEPPAMVQAGQAFPLVVGAEDQFGNPTLLTGSVTFTIATGPSVTGLVGVNPVTAAGGTAAFSLYLSTATAAIPYTLQASSPNLAPATTTAITVTPAPATQLVIPDSGEPPASVNAGQTFSMVVDAEDQFGNLATSFMGSVMISSPNVIMGAVPVSATNGVATFSNLSIDKAGTYQLQATSTGLTAGTSTSVTVNALTVPAQLAWAPEPPTSVIHGVPFAATIDVEDQYGNVDPAFDGSVIIALDQNPGGAVLGGNLSVTASAGVAAFPGLTINNVANGYTLVAMGAGLTSPQSTPINVTPIPAVGLNVSTEPPATVQVAQTFGLTVTVFDQAGGPDPDFNGSVTVAIASASASNMLAGATTINAIGGIATFSGLTLADVGTVTLQASVSGLSSVTTSVINVTAAAPSQLALVTEPPASVTAGAPFGFEVEAEDRFGNLATSFNGSVTVALSPNAGNAALGGPVTALASDGVAFFTGLTVDQAGSAYTIAVTSTGLTAATTTPFSVTPAAPAQLLILTQPPPSVTAGEAFGLSVEVVDTFGNVETSFDGPVTIGLLSNSSTTVGSNPLTVDAMNGVATFSGYTIVTAASGYTIEATSGSLTPAISNPITVTPAAPATLVVVVEPPANMVAGSDFGLDVIVQDQYGNLATQFNGNVSIALLNDPGGAPLIGGPTTIAANAGVANFLANKMTLDVAASGYTIQVTSPGLTPATTTPINVTAAPATQLVVVTEPPSTVAAGGSFGFVVAAEDPYNNVNLTFSGQVSAAPPSGSGVTLGGTTTVTASQGLATFSGLGLANASVPVALTVSSAGLTSTQTTPVSEITVAPLTAQIAFAVASENVDENAGDATFQVVRTGTNQGAISVQVATSGGTAVAGVNYTAISQTLNFAAGVDSQTITIPVINAGVLSTALTVNVVLSAPGTGATLGSPSTATLYILNTGQSTQTAPLVTLETVRVVKNKKHQVKDVVLTFSGGLNAAEAASTTEYTLVQAGKKGSFIAKNAKAIKLRSAAYNSANGTVTLMPRKPFGLSKPVRLVVNGEAPSGLEDSYSRLIDGNDDGQAGGDAIAVLKSKGVTISALSGGSAAVDVLLERGELATLAKARKR